MSAADAAKALLIAMMPNTGDVVSFRVVRFAAPELADVQPGDVVRIEVSIHAGTKAYVNDKHVPGLHTRLLRYDHLVQGAEVADLTREGLSRRPSLTPP